MVAVVVAFLFSLLFLGEGGVGAVEWVAFRAVVLRDGHWGPRSGRASDAVSRGVALDKWFAIRFQHFLPALVASDFASDKFCARATP